jgi:hypothetical protein
VKLETNESSPKKMKVTQEQPKNKEVAAEPLIARYDVDGNLLAAKLDPSPTLLDSITTTTTAMLPTNPQTPTCPEVVTEAAKLAAQITASLECKLDQASREVTNPQTDSQPESGSKLVRLPIVRKLEDYVLRPNSGESIGTPLITVLSEGTNEVRI